MCQPLQIHLTIDPQGIRQYGYLGKGPFILLCQIVSVECPTNLNFPLLTSNQNKESPKQPISMKRGSKFVEHSTEIIGQSKIKGPLPTEVFQLVAGTQH